jgi:cytidylate kinase
MILAIDGPAASGKGTLARRLAARFGLRHLDTGLTYRAVAERLLAGGRALDDEAAAIAAARSLDLAALDRDRLAAHGIGEAASRVAVLPGLRRALVEVQRAFAVEPPGAVLDGRDVGTVICPDADVKLFLTASAEARAARRTAELAGKGTPVAFAEVLDDLRRRDARDAGRDVSPMRPAADAVVLDTTGLDVDAAFAAALAVVEARLAGGAG